MLEDEMSLCKVMMLYLAEGRSLELIENIFRSSKTKGRVIYNTMISVYGKHFAENAHQLFLEMVNNRIRLSGHTFKYHLEAWTIACKPQRTLEFLHFMILFFIKVYFPCIIIVLTPKHNFEKWDQLENVDIILFPNFYGNYFLLESKVRVLFFSLLYMFFIKFHV